MSSSVTSCFVQVSFCCIVICFSIGVLLLCPHYLEDITSYMLFTVFEVLDVFSSSYQMSSVDAAIDRRILESRLAHRMTF